MTRKCLMLVFYTAVVSGFAIFINTYGVKGMDPAVFAFSKNVIVATVLFSMLFGLGRFSELRRITRKQWSKLAMIGLIGGSAPFILFFKGLQMTTGTTSAFIHKTLFVYVTVFAMLFLKEKLTKGLFIGAVMLLAGNYLMLKPGFNLSLGHLLILTATVLWAAENTLSKHALKELSGTTVAFGRMFFGSAFIMLFLAITGKLPSVIAMNGPQYAWILITAAILVLYVYSYYNGLKHIKVTTAACIISLGAPITTALSWIFSGKTLSVHSAVGMLLILLGIVAVVSFSQLTSRVVVAHERG